MAGNIQSKITYMVENAQGLCNALYELALCDENISTECLNSKIYEKKASAYELLRIHNTCASLICVLSNTLDSIMKELDLLDGMQTDEAQPAKGGEKRNGRKT